MEVQVNIEFQQLVQLAKSLPVSEWEKLKREVETEAPNNFNNKEREEFKKLLLNGPTFTKKQLNVINETRKSINQWRIK